MKHKYILNLGNIAGIKEKSSTNPDEIVSLMTGAISIKNNKYTLL